MSTKLAVLAQAILALTAARDLLARAECPRAADKVRHALKSAEGAYRNRGGAPSERSYRRALNIPQGVYYHLAVKVYDGRADPIAFGSGRTEP